MKHLCYRARVVVRVFQHTLSADVRLPRVCALRRVKNKRYVDAFDGLACFIGKSALFLIIRGEQYESLSLCAFRCIPSEKLRNLSS